ncbi:patatin-like phospholipase family protein [Tichowtungia aerotolerans]|uniref:Patatin-like phospholipase family protein n=1 Tax=Tichowtungia aerotolerans TaxID=2697043 RepID=A0A6P1MD77_9BACT|nr:patatin-like phospholipase family protein [Tichowtungia aerotolerans]QHI70524.1 patatin-like phospholipase family protein [Tichowtungia aerotolerans]
MRLFRRKPKKIGLALGGGGARGLAHIHVLETLDELGIRPHAIAGTSIGSIMGALYASGLTGLEIRDLVDRLLLRNVEKVSDVFTRKDILRWIGLIDPSFQRGSLVKGEKFVRFLSESMDCSAFEELQIPLHVSTTDYTSGQEVVFSSGDLLSAVRASMAIPGFFAPVEREGKVLVDGGLVNPLPYNLLKQECDAVIAVDVSGSLEMPNKRPDFFDAMLGSFDIVQSALISEQLRRDPPAVYLKPDLHGIRILEFNKAGLVFEQSEPIRGLLKDKAGRLL